MDAIQEQEHTSISVGERKQEEQVKRRSPTRVNRQAGQ